MCRCLVFSLPVFAAAGAAATAAADRTPEFPHGAAEIRRIKGSAANGAAAQPEPPAAPPALGGARAEPPGDSGTSGVAAPPAAAPVPHDAPSDAASSPTAAR